MTALAALVAASVAVLAVGDPKRCGWATGALGTFLLATALLWGAVRQGLP